MSAALTPQEVQRAGILANQALQGKRLFFVRINPSLNTLKRVTTQLLQTVRRVDPTDYAPDGFETVLRVLSESSELIRSFYVLYDQGGDLDFLRTAADELDQARRWVIQGLAPDPSSGPLRQNSIN